MSEALTVKLPDFEGPLDLLVHLIEKDKVDIYDIPHRINYAAVYLIHQ